MGGLFGKRPSIDKPDPEPEPIPELIEDEIKSDETKRRRRQGGRRSTIRTGAGDLNPTSVGRKSLLGG